MPNLAALRNSRATSWELVGTGCMLPDIRGNRSAESPPSRAMPENGSWLHGHRRWWNTDQCGTASIGSRVTPVTFEGLGWFAAVSEGLEMTAAGRPGRDLSTCRTGTLHRARMIRITCGGLGAHWDRDGKIRQNAAKSGDWDWRNDAAYRRWV